MINGAIQIIAGVPGRHLDPLLLAQSQAKDSAGFIMIAYQRQSIAEDQSPSRFYDLLFFRGPEIFECARLNQDLRFQLHQEAAFQTFKNFCRDNGTKVYLFLASDELLHRFRSTFYYEPCLKVQVKALSKKQIVTLLKNTGCQRGIIECNEFTQLAPSLELFEISSPDDIIQYRPKFKNGRILLYDTEKNKELVQERYSVLSKRLTQPAGDSLRTDSQRQEEPDRAAIQIFGASRQQEARELEPFDDEKEAQEFTEFIKKILNGPTTTDEQVREDKKVAEETFLITRKPDAAVLPVVDPKTNIEKHPVPRKARQKSKGKEISSQHTEQRSIKSEGVHPVSATSLTVDATTASDQSNFIRLFERLFRSFRQQVFECYGDKCEAVIADAERKVRFLTPEFDLHPLNNETAVVVLDLVETIANDAPFFKKSKLREAALTLVADLYNKQYELLERQHAIEKVEQFYYRLKR
jgi:hypothetical protein